MTTKNILILGSTGKGKSTLINALADKEVAKEASSSISITSKIQAVEVNRNGQTYKLIDTVGFADTQFTPIEVLEKLTDIGKEIKNGISQIFFVFDGRFDKEQLKLYLNLRKILLNGEAYKHTTLIRTHFPNFEDDYECSKDHGDLLKSITDNWKKEPNKEYEELINLLSEANGIVYVDNPPLLAHYKEISKKTRDKSRIKLFKHLENNCNKNYEVDIEGLKEKIINLRCQTKELNQEIKRLIKENKDLQENLELTQAQKETELAKLQEQKEILIDKLEVFEAEQKEFIIFRSRIGNRIELLKKENTNKNNIIDRISEENKILQENIKELEQELENRKERTERLEQIAQRFDQRTEWIEKKAERERQEFKTQIRELRQEQKPKLFEYLRKF